jgi:hypothetical protein
MGSRRPRVPTQLSKHRVIIGDDVQLGDQATAQAI